MVRHIFKKDLKLAWHVILGANGLLWIMAATLVLARRWNNPQLGSLLEVMEPLAYMGLAFLITFIVQQDPIPGVRQDWLVRPIRRRDLLFSKVICVLLMVHGSMLAADLFQGMANGFSFRQSMPVALARNIEVLCLLTLPLVALASFTRTLSEATVWIVMLMMVGGGVQIVLSSLLMTGPGPGRIFEPTSYTGVEWVGDWVRMCVLLAGASLVLALQYFRRKTIQARCLAGVVGIVVILTELLPWNVAFAVQERLSSEAGAGRAVSMVFDPGMGRAQRPAELKSNDMISWIRSLQGNAIVLLPLHITGVPDDSVLRDDRTEVQLTTAEGKVLHLDSRDDFHLLQEGHGDGEGRIHAEIRMKQERYEQLKNEPIRMELEYSLTLFRLQGAHALPALGGRQEIPDMGRCTTMMDDEADDVNVRCMIPGRRTGCVTVFMEHIPSGRRNPEIFSCSADYEPYAMAIIPDVMGGGRVNLPFRDLNGLAHYPVDGNQLPQSQVVLRNYQPVDHFTRHIVVSQIKLSDWEPQ